MEARARQAAEKSGNSWTLDYGASLPTMEQLNVPPVHELGLSGHGIIVRAARRRLPLTNFTLTHIPILAQYDFVHDDSVVTPEPGDFAFQHRHRLAGAVDIRRLAPAISSARPTGSR